MKKNYVKPVFYREYFVANEYITSCVEQATYNPVRVDCVISRHHHVFYSNCTSSCNESDCDGGINILNATVVEMTDKSQYLVWENTHSGGPRSTVYARPNGGSSNGLVDILQRGEDTGVLDTDATENWQKYHAGKITPDIVSGMNHS